MPLRTWSDEALIGAVAQNISVAGVLRSLGLTVNPGSYVTIRRHVERLKLDTSHFLGQRHGTARPPTHRPLSEYLVKAGPVISSDSLKRKLLVAGRLVLECAVCGLGPIWCGKELVLQLDHVDGDGTNNEVTNLRLLCPNCHTQTPTFTSRKLRFPDKLCTCGTKITSRSKQCLTCSQKVRKKKGKWPDDRTLVQWLDTMTAVDVGRRVGVSSEAVKKYCTVRKIETKPRGFWQKVKQGKRANLVTEEPGVG